MASQIGFIGLGTMGARIAARLVRAGHPLMLHDVRREAAAALVEQGAAWAESPQALAQSCEIIFSSLPGPAEVEAVATGTQGLRAGIRPEAVYFDLSTNSLAVVKRLHDAFAARGTQMLDAPVSGGPAGAASGRLAIWASGDEQAFNRCKSVLDALGDQAAYIGPIGAATVAKLVHNCLGYILNRGLSEVFTLGVKAGVDPLTLFAAVRQGALGRARTFDSLMAHFLPQSYDPPAFALRLAYKDVSLATDLGRELEVPMPMANLALAELTAALNRGWSGRDSRVAMELQKERAGVQIAVPPEQLRALLDRASKK